MTDDGGSRDYAADGHNALVVPVKDAKAMRRAIERVLDDQELRTRLVDAGLRTAHEYHWDQVTRTFVDLVFTH
jgi:glycosyltransferase involved in cell wall biosynthesis